MSRFQSPLEITVISAEGLVYRNRSITKNIFVTVRTDPTNHQSTSVDEAGGCNPSWNEKLQLALPAASSAKLVVGVEVRRKTSTSGSQLIGIANIPMSDIFGDYVPSSHLHFLSYRLRESDGKKNGIINLSIKMVGRPEIGYPVACGFGAQIPLTRPSYVHQSCEGSGHRWI
ncbi:BON1-associated protein 2 [Cinnamomum micranthum f. kanehirae]|uniref:BON1-associated protein 2 n=1 Tax=Cinnamomum micranthum f. kanehirae TaxID=337451 RepID=A0A3S3N1Q6_9MAGN|nr:BON1-associated protein 2 [Cinnamomum micranthum f. kanehirae]